MFLNTTPAVAPAQSSIPTEGADAITGTAFEDLVDALGGDDVVFGGTGGDTLAGGLGNDTLYADTHAGYQQPGTADAPDAWNQLFGDAGDDILVGGAGLDDLYGGTGNDILSGGAGADWFIFEPGSGLDCILDFTPGEDQLWALTNMNGTGAPMITQNVDGAVVDFGNGNAVLLAGVDAAYLPADAIAFY